jgi:hypothetical protein
MKSCITILWVMTPCSMVGEYRRVILLPRGYLDHSILSVQPGFLRGLFWDSEDGGNSRLTSNALHGIISQKIELAVHKILADNALNLTFPLAGVLIACSPLFHVLFTYRTPLQHRVDTGFSLQPHHRRSSSLTLFQIGRVHITPAPSCTFCIPCCQHHPLSTSAHQSY